MQPTLSAFVFIMVLGSAPLFGQAVSGADIYSKSCASCHDQISPRIPTRDALQKMSAARIIRTLDFGLMMSIAYPLRRDEREAVAKYLGTATADAPPPANAFCTEDKRAMSGSVDGNWGGWSPASDNSRYQPTDGSPALNRNLVPRLKLKWAFGFPDDVTAFGAPAVLNGTLFTGSAAGIVYALDTRTGCIHWTFQAAGPVRSTTVGVQAGSSTR